MYSRAAIPSQVHVDVAQRIAQAAADSGVCERFIHISCLGASPDSASRRLQTKVLAV